MKDIIIILGLISAVYVLRFDLKEWGLGVGRAPHPKSLTTAQFEALRTMLEGGRNEN